jgi:hypothetical protein
LDDRQPPGGDKVGSLQRRARAKIAADAALAAASIGEQVAAFRSLLPDNRPSPPRVTAWRTRSA